MNTRTLLTRCFSANTRALNFRTATRQNFIKSSAICKRSQHDTATCWKCQREQPTISTVYCHNPQCKAIQPTSNNVNYFELMGAGEGKECNQSTFYINEGSLKKKYLELQRIAHPDSFTRVSEREHKYAENQSALISKAYQTLKDPLSRAKYILNQAGYEAIDANQQALRDPELLMQVMDTIEELEQCTTPEQVEEMKAINEDKFQSTIQKLSNAISKKDFNQVQEYIVQLQYLENIRQAISNH